MALWLDLWVGSFRTPQTTAGQPRRTTCAVHSLTLWLGRFLELRSAAKPWGRTHARAFLTAPLGILIHPKTGEAQKMKDLLVILCHHTSMVLLVLFSLFLVFCFFYCYYYCCCCYYYYYYYYYYCYSAFSSPD